MHYSRLMRYNDLDRSYKTNKPGDGCITPHGYKKISVNGRRTYEHRYVMECLLGRKLEKHEIVHHINHDTLDNSPQNLELLSQSEHSKGHNTKTFRNETHKQCTKCFVMKPREQFTWVKPNGPNGDTHSPSCKSCKATLKRIRLRGIVNH